MQRFVIALMMAALFFPAVSWAVDFSIGVSPSIVETGDVSPGEQKIVQFSIFTVSDEPLLVYLTPENGRLDFFLSRFPQFASNFSEEGAFSWVEFLNNPVEINTNGTKTVGRSWKEVKMLLHVPENAEPGYHLIHILPKPYFYGGSKTPVGTNMVTMTQISILIKVRGEGKREGIILDTNAGGNTDNGFGTGIVFQNTGTVTMSTFAELKLYNKNGQQLEEFRSLGQQSRPQTITTYSIFVPGKHTETKYDVLSTVNFYTGKAEQNTSIILSVLTATAKAIEPTKQEFLPWIILLAIVIIILIIIYKKRRNNL